MPDREEKDHYFLIFLKYHLQYLDNLLIFLAFNCLQNVKNFRGVRFRSLFNLILCNRKQFLLYL